MTTTTASSLALLGGPKSVTGDDADLFRWPLCTAEHEEAVLKLMRTGNMSGWDITAEFEREYAAALGRQYALGSANGTMAILTGLYGMGVGVGHEVLVPSLTYWASAVQVYSLGATPVFVDIDPATLNLDPGDLEHRISPRTRAIVVVHYLALPCAMDAIMAIANRHGIPVLEDFSHAHGALYRGRQVGTFGQVAACSLMAGKSLACGESGMLFTDDRRVYDRCLLFGTYERHGRIEAPDLKELGGIPCGGIKARMHQVSAAFGRIQLRRYPEQMREIDRAMTCFCQHLQGCPGVEPILAPPGSGTTKGGWYVPGALYHAEQLGGLSVSRFAEAVRAEGAACGAGINRPLHLHPAFLTMDIYGHGKPTRIANLPPGVDVRQWPGSLPHTEAAPSRCLQLPWFKVCDDARLATYAAAYRKVAEHYRELLPGDQGNPPSLGGWSTSFRR